MSRGLGLAKFRVERSSVSIVVECIASKRDTTISNLRNGEFISGLVEGMYVGQQYPEVVVVVSFVTPIADWASVYPLGQRPGEKWVYGSQPGGMQAVLFKSPR